VDHFFFFLNNADGCQEWESILNSRSRILVQCPLNLLKAFPDEIR